MGDFSKIFDEWFKINKPRILSDLMEYMSINTCSPNESDAFTFLHEIFRDLGAETWEEPIKKGALHHAERCPSPMSKATEKSHNFMARLETEIALAKKESVLVSCHIDVVPAGPSWNEAFNPKIVTNDVGDEFVVGRGACDTKGNLLMLIAALRFLKEKNLPRKYSIIYDGVIEEEVGGLGALSTSVSNVTDSCIGALVFEPTSLQCFRGHRGCLGISIIIKGRSGHMGAGQGMGPIQAIGPLVNDLADLENELIEVAKQDEAYSDCHRPVQINVGLIEGGEWHGTVVESCHLLVNVGFPPQYTLQKIEERIRSLLAKRIEKTGLEHELICDGLRNDAYLDGKGKSFQQEFISSLRSSGLDVAEPKAWHVSCDGRTYAKKMGLPTIIFGCGDLADAHSSSEKLSVLDLKSGTFALASFFTNEN